MKKAPLPVSVIVLMLKGCPEFRRTPFFYLGNPLLLYIIVLLYEGKLI